VTVHPHIVSLTQHLGQRLGLGDVAREDIVGKREPPLVESNTDGHLPTVFALLFVLSVAGFGFFVQSPSKCGLLTS